MVTNPAAIKETIVGTLLQFADCVIEVNTLKQVLNQWDNTDLYGDATISFDIKCLVDGCGAAIDQAHRRKAPAPIDHIDPSSPFGYLYNVKVIPNDFNLDSVFLIVEHKDTLNCGYTQSGIGEIATAFRDLGWATWHINAKTKQINFSEKWYSMFGYGKDEIHTSTEWTSKIHHDDLETRRKIWSWFCIRWRQSESGIHQRKPNWTSAFGAHPMGCGWGRAGSGSFGRWRKSNSRVLYQ